MKYSQIIELEFRLRKYHRWSQNLSFPDKTNSYFWSPVLYMHVQYVHMYVCMHMHAYMYMHTHTHHCKGLKTEYSLKRFCRFSKKISSVFSGWGEQHGSSPVMMLSLSARKSASQVWDPRTTLQSECQSSPQLLPTWQFKSM